MTKYAIIFTRKDYSGCTTILSFKDSLDEAIKAARKEYQEILYNVEPGHTIEKSIEDENTELGNDEDLFEKDLKYSLYHTKALQEVLVQEISI
jgi:translation initiation factor 2 beta subunit (eIF-2beta)/eIF-5